MHRSLFKTLVVGGLVICCSCKREAVTPQQAQQPISSARPSPTPTPAIAPTVCNYDLDETALTGAGWTKTFEDNFTTDLSKWNIWTGGAFNNELQYYQAANLQVANGELAIVTKKETVSGATTPFDATQKIFNYTSGRIECKTNVS